MHQKKVILFYRAIGILMSIIAIVLCVVYFVVFHGDVSSNSADWEAFGAYFSVIVAILNLVFFIIITIYVARIQDESSNQQLNQEKEMHLQDYKWNRLEDLYKVVNSFQSIPTVRINSESIKAVYFESWRLSRYIYHFSNNNQTLFSSIDFSKSVQNSQSFTDYLKDMNDRRDFTINDLQKLTNLRGNLDESLYSMIKDIQDNLLEKTNE